MHASFFEQCPENIKGKKVFWSSLSAMSVTVKVECVLLFAYFVLKLLISTLSHAYP